MTALLHTSSDMSARWTLVPFGADNWSSAWCNAYRLDSNGVPTTFVGQFKSLAAALKHLA